MGNDDDDEEEDMNVNRDGGDDFVLDEDGFGIAGHDDDDDRGDATHQRQVIAQDKLF